MTRINLLPWREERRKQRQKDFGVMLALAALNRFHLTPLLQQSIAAGDYNVAIRALRRSMALEFGAVVLILGLVAWLGTVAPD